MAASYLLLLGVVALARIQIGAGTDVPLTNEEIATLDKEMQEEIEMNAIPRGHSIMSPEDRWYLTLNPVQRSVYNEMEKGRDPEVGRVRGKGRQFDAIDNALATIESVVENAVAASGVVEKLKAISSGIVDGVVNAAKISFEIAKQVNLLRPRAKGRSAEFMKGILYEAQFQTENLCNVVVANLTKGFEPHLSGITFFKAYSIEGSNFGLWLASGGYFRYKAESKEEPHWGFGGAYSKAGLRKDRVHFNHRPCYKSPE